MLAQVETLLLAVACLINDDDNDDNNEDDNEHDDDNDDNDNNDDNNDNQRGGVGTDDGAHKNQQMMGT
jgi:hypothetical protein